MERFIAEANIKRYRELLAGDLDAVHRQRIERLLAEEQARLAEMTKSDRLTGLAAPAPKRQLIEHCRSLYGDQLDDLARGALVGAGRTDAEAW